MSGLLNKAPSRAAATIDVGTSAAGTLDAIDCVGDITALYRRTEWSTTSAGSPASWSPALRSALRMILNTGHPAVILWGEDGACLYNQAYRTAVHPRHAPGTAAKVVAAEVWDLVGPQFEQVMNGGPATWHENQLIRVRLGDRLQDTYCTYGFSAIDDPAAAGGIGGALVLCALTTELVMARQRAVAEADRLRTLFDQAPSFVAMLNGPNHRIEFANEAYRRLVGGREVVGRLVAEGVPGAVEQGFVDLLDTVFRTGEAFVAKSAPYQIEAPSGQIVELCLDFIYQPVKDANGAVTGICVQGNDVTELTRALNQLTRIARIDELTGLPNRTATLEAIGRAIAAQRRVAAPFSLLYIDLDGFKHLNDRSGHAAGDQALGEVGGALATVIRANDTAGRVGGDEFAVVVSGGRAAAEGIAARLRAEIAGRMAARGWIVSASIGVAVFATPPSSADAALAEADAAMYVVKRRMQAT